MLSSKNKEKYKLSKLKKTSLLIGYALVAALIYICLTPNPPDTSAVNFGDKIAHFAGYALLFLWFAQIYQRSAQLKLALLLVLLGVSIEIAQGFTGYRAFEYADMLANSVGVAIGWVVAATPAASLLLMIEKRFLNSSHKRVSL